MYNWSRYWFPVSCGASSSTASTTKRLSTILRSFWNDVTWCLRFLACHALKTMSIPLSISRWQLLTRAFEGVTSAGKRSL